MRRSTWIVLVVFIVSVGVLFFWQRQQAQTPEATPTPGQEAIFSLESNNLQAVRIEGNGSETIAFERGENLLWELTEPEGAAADIAQVEGLVTQLLGLRSISRLDQPPPVEATGLAVPMAVITLEPQSGTELKLVVGNLTPTQSGYYAQLDDGPVLIVSKFTIDAALEALVNPPVEPTPTAAVDATLPVEAATDTPQP